MGGSTTVQAPAPVNPAQVGADTLRTQLELAPQVFAANQQYLPQYAELANRVASQMLPGLLQQQAGANTAQRSSDIADVRALAPQALEAWRAANPEFGQAMGALSQRISSSAGRAAPQIGDYRPTGGLVSRLEQAAGGMMDQVTPLQIEMQRQAMEQLGGDLTPEQLGKVQQDTRAAYAARGLYDSNQAIGAEILNIDSARQQRRAAAQQFAQGQIDRAQQFVGNAAGLGQAAAQFNAGLATDRDRTNAQLALGADQQAISNYFNLANSWASSAQDPYQLVLGRSGAPAASQALAANAGPTMFNPFDPGITQIYAGNQANQMAARVASANNSSAMGGAALGAIGTIGAGALIAF